MKSVIIIIKPGHLCGSIGPFPLQEHPPGTRILLRNLLPLPVSTWGNQGLKFSPRPYFYSSKVPGQEVVLFEGPGTIEAGSAVLNVTDLSNTEQYF